MCCEMVVESESIVVEAGQPGETSFVIADGEVEVATGGNRPVRLGPGEFFGEMSLLDGLPRSATVSAVSHTTLIAIDRATFRELLTSTPSIALALLGVMSRRLRDRLPSPDA